MLFKKNLNKNLKNTAYKHSLANKPTKKNYYVPYSSTLAPFRRNNNIKLIITSKTIKDI